MDYISVPVVPELLRAKVSVFAELHRKTEQLERLNAELRHLSTRLMATQDEERRRMARELHDGLGQDLVAAKMLLDRHANANLKSADGLLVKEAAEMVDQAIKQTRNISHLLHPPLLDEVGIFSALTWYVEGFSKRSGIKTSIEIQPPAFPRLGPELETALFRIVQEALTNVFRHSDAKTVTVNVDYRGGKVRASVQDDGKGISPSVAGLRVGSIGVGVGGMKQRVKELGGELKLCSTSPGTLLEVVVPFTEPTFSKR